MKLNRWFLLIFMLLIFKVHATHNRAGEISYQQISGLTFEFTITTFTYAPSPADRCELELFFGDGTSEVVQRVNGTASSCGCNHCGEIVAPDIRYNVYITTHTFSSAGEYTVYFEDPNRNGGVINIPNSINVPFYIESTIVINPFLGSNNSPVLLNPPIDNACVGSPFYHNPGAYDIDGDSISYKLVRCRGEDGLEIAGYEYPDASNFFGIDEVDGTLTWDYPQIQGEYNVAILIEEWRNGILIGKITRDMQIFVQACDNDPPVIADFQELCIEAGNRITFPVVATDANNDLIEVTAEGHPFEVLNSASLTEILSNPGIAEYEFNWQTTCNDVQKMPHNVYFKATDDGDPVNLVNFNTATIKVIAPAPDTLIATPVGNYVNLEWAESVCGNALGYRIFRSFDSTGNTVDECETGVPANWGYSQIAEVQGVRGTAFKDDNNGKGLVHGIRYCYIVVAYFSDGAESKPSIEACATLQRDVPIITQVSISKTDVNAGVDTIRWLKPLDEFLTQFTPPYNYRIYCKYNSESTFTQVGSTNNIDATMFIDRNANTVDTSIIYRIDMYDANTDLVGSTHEGSSIFLTTEPADNEVILQWNNNMPWKNYLWDVYSSPDTNTFDFQLIATTDEPLYIDTGLVNGQDYFYYVVSHGKYTADSLPQNIINYSQIVSEIPVDMDAPPAPLLDVVPNCETMENSLYWTDINNEYNDVNDVVSYNVFFTPQSNLDYSQILATNDPNIVSFIHQDINSVAGCYYVTAIDSFENVSPASNIVCIDIDSCQLYRLPNVFTPNSDGFNDFFEPFPYDYVDHIYIEIYNRWEQKVFETTDPDINWDGINQTSKQACSEGVYFYICEVYEIRLTGLKKRILKGAVHLYR